MNDFLSEFLEYTKSYESCTEWFIWAALAGIGAIIRDNCYLLLGDTRLYPNIYVLIIGKPALRKAKPLNSIIELMKVINNTKIIEGRTSIQAVIQRLGEIERTKDSKTITGASGIIYSEEISAMFTDDESNIPILGDLYDFKSTYTSSLVSRATTKLNNVVVSLLGASNEELLRPIFNNRAIYGGLLSRCLIIYGDKVRHRNSLMWEDPRQYDPSHLRSFLFEVSKLKGLFVIDDEAKTYYDKWYHDICPQLERKANNTGAEGRIHTNVLKVAMILAVSHNKSLQINTPILEEAIEKVLSLFANYRRLSMGAGKSKDAEVKVLFLKLLWESGIENKYTLSRRDIVSKTCFECSSEELDVVERNLLEGGFIQVREDKNKKEYKLTEQSINFFISRIPEHQ